MRLPARLGGLGLPSLAATADANLTAASTMTSAQVKEIFLQNVSPKTPTFAEVHIAAITAKNASAKLRKSIEADAFKKPVEDSTETTVMERSVCVADSSPAPTAWV